MTHLKLQNCGQKVSLLLLTTKRFLYPILLFLISFAFAPGAKTESIKVVADMKPVHSLVSMVLGDLDTSGLIISREVSPHDYAMRPSDARLISDANVVFWTGPAIIPQIEKFLDGLPNDIQVVSLLDESEDLLLPIRDLSFLFDDDDHSDEHDHQKHDDEHEGHDEHDHDDGKEENGHEEEDEHHGDKHDHQKHGDEHEGHDEHDHDDGKEENGHEEHGHLHHHHGDFDPHAWLDPYVALHWLDIIADTMMAIDPDNSEIYASNVANAKEIINELDQNIRSQLEDLDPQFILYHDAFHYFEKRYGLSAVGIIADQSSAEPGARHIRRLIAKIKEVEVTCAFTEPVFEDDLVKTVVAGAEIGIYEIDPTGATLEPGTDLYVNLISGIADSFVTCTSDG